MEWVQIENQNEIPSDIFTHGNRILIEDTYDVMAVVYWDGYGWNICDSGNSELDDARIQGKIKRYVILE